jgi:DNA-directed RNA polymerase subunit M/transcription elongation factor TFIIS
MPISFECPHCGKKLKAPDSASGKQSPCPRCGHLVNCPEPVVDAEVVEITMEPIEDELDPYGIADQDAGESVMPRMAAEPAADGRRPCPMCGEMIVTTAAKCRFCGEVFDATLKKATAKKKKKKQHSHDDEVLSGLEMLVGIFCAGIGCICGIVYMIQGKPKGIKLLGLSIMMAIVWNVVRFFVIQSLSPNGPGGP